MNLVPRDRNLPADTNPYGNYDKRTVEQVRRRYTEQQGREILAEQADEALQATYVRQRDHLVDNFHHVQQELDFFPDGAKRTEFDALLSGQLHNFARNQDRIASALASSGAQAINAPFKYEEKKGLFGKR